MVGTASKGGYELLNLVRKVIHDPQGTLKEIAKHEGERLRYWGQGYT